MTRGEAIVIKNTGSHYELSALPEWNLFPAVLRGKIRLKGGSSTNPVAVGDQVVFEYEQDPTPEHPAVIVEVKPRRNYVIRRSTNLSRQSHIIAANLDQAVLIVSLYFPEVKLAFLDRLLVTCEVYNVHPVIVLNKVDLYASLAPESMAAFHEIYEGAGYRIIETSTVTGEGIDELRECVAGKVSLFSGESGVGKSSLIKALDPALDPKTGEISQAHLQGRHTTTFYEMYRISSGGYVVDTPGLRGFGLVDLEKEEIPLYFPEMLRVSQGDDGHPGCRFTPCTHTHEPHCAVKAAVEDGRVSPERYNSYLGMLEEDGKFR